VLRWSHPALRLGWLLGATTLLGVISVLFWKTVTLLAVFVLPSTIAALSLTPAATAVVAAYASVWGLSVALVAHVFSGAGRGTGFYTVLVVAAISVVAAHRRQRQESTLRRISMVAEAAQATIVRPIPSRLGVLTFATVYRSAAEEARVGGDAYAAVAHPGGVRLLVADVRGKGLEAVGLAADVLASFREFAPGTVRLVDVAHHLDRAISASLSDEDFVTALLVDFTAAEIGLVSCGHPWPLLRRGGRVEEIVIDRPSRPLGLGIRPTLQSQPFEPGDQLFVFTDGLIETRNRSGIYFDPIAALADLPPADTPREVLDALITRLDDHAGGRLGDDLAIVLAEYTAEPAVPRIEGVRVLAGEELTPG
jgi:sigma-B regulation protein RsbU (phosphoserine phosphatase)